MKISRYVLALSLSILSYSTRATGDSITVSPSLDLSYKRLQYTFRGSKLPNAALLSVSPTLNIGSGRWYASLSYETPIESHDDTSVRFLGGSSVARIASDQVEQTTANFTIGFRLTENWSVFGGFLKTKHEYNTLLVSTDTSIASFNTNYRLDDSGVFLGAGYTFKIGQKSSIGLSLAIGDLDSKLVLMDNEFSTNFGKTTSDGYSANVVWTSPVGESLSLRAGARYTDYKLKGSPVTQHSYYTYFVGLASFF